MLHDIKPNLGGAPWYLPLKIIKRKRSGINKWNALFRTKGCKMTLELKAYRNRKIKNRIFRKVLLNFPKAIKKHKDPSKLKSTWHNILFSQSYHAIALHWEAYEKNSKKNSWPKCRHDIHNTWKLFSLL